jgi:hypothetical protein
MSFPTKKFDLTLPTNGGISVCLIGASRSGKTTMMKYLYNTFFKKCITVMCTMNPQADIYKDFGKKVLVSDQYHPEVLKEMHEINTVCDNKFDFCFISDDYVDSKVKGDPEITRCMTIYRNAGFFNSIWSFQGRVLMSAVGRNNANYICIFKQNTAAEYENIIKEFLSMYLPSDMSMREMVEFVKIATADHQFFCIDNITGDCYISKLSKDQIV